jgi:hypothetical protein
MGYDCEHEDRRRLPPQGTLPSLGLTGKCVSSAKRFLTLEPPYRVVSNTSAFTGFVGCCGLVEECTYTVHRTTARAQVQWVVDEA